MLPPRGTKIAIECYTKLYLQWCTIVYPLLDHAGIFFVAFSHACLNTQCKQSQQNKVRKNFCVCPVCVWGGEGGGEGGRGPPGPSPGSATGNSKGTQYYLSSKGGSVGIIIIMLH